MKKKRSQKQSKNNKIFKYLQRYPIDERKKIIHKNILLGINMQELKPEE
jgi:hypothetical protein